MNIATERKTIHNICLFRHRWMGSQIDDLYEIGFYLIENRLTVDDFILKICSRKSSTIQFGWHEKQKQTNDISVLCIAFLFLSTLEA